nr:InlB B-repeat-containing protein [uncultured Agathobaculum sp.]
MAEPSSTRRRYGLFGVSNYPAKSGLDERQRASMARWAAGVVALLAVAVIVLLLISSKSPGLTVTFDSQGGSEAAVQHVKYGALAQEPEPVVRPGYTLAGWSIAPDGAPLWDFSSDTVTGTLTLYAIWLPEGAS